MFFFFTDQAPTEIYPYCHPLSLHAPLPIFAEMIDRQMLGPAAQGYRDRAQDILADAHRLLAAIDDMDAAARGANGAPDGPQRVDAGGVVERVIGRYRGRSTNGRAWWGERVGEYVEISGASVNEKKKKNK